MKNIFLRLVVFIFIASTLSGCYGKFALTRKVYALNGEVKDKFLRSGLTWVFLIVPVYGVVGLVDFVVLNTIEFWSGKNPVAEGEKTFQYVDGADRYEIHAFKRGGALTYNITRYSFDSYVDSLQIDWNQSQDIAWSRYSTGTSITDNYATRDVDGIHVQVRQPGYLPQTVALVAQ